MKSHKIIFLSIFFILLITGCKEKITDTYFVNVPVYMSGKDFKKSVTITGAEELVKPGKIYFKDKFIFINENLKGIHVIDNSNPELPKFVSFIKIPGNVDMAIKDSILFADSFVDLVALNIKDISNIREVGRVDSIFPYSLPPVPDNNELPFTEVDVTKGIVVGWEVKEISVEVGSESPRFNFLRAEPMFFDGAFSKEFSSSGSNSMSVGIGGSMARFTIFGNFLYTVDMSNLRTFDIGDLKNPLIINDQSIGWNVETVFQYRGKLFFGTQTGMIIYDLVIPSAPKYVSNYRHIKSCDPVVVEGDYAYVTLRAGNLCGDATSQLEVIDVSNPADPQWEESYPMQEPYGLGIDNTTLFVCDGIAGLKVYNASDPHNLVKIAWFPDVSATDVIPFNGLLMMIGEEGLYQYDYTGPENIRLLSHMELGKKD